MFQCWCYWTHLVKQIKFLRYLGWWFDSCTLLIFLTYFKFSIFYEVHITNILGTLKKYFLISLELKLLHVVYDSLQFQLWYFSKDSKLKEKPNFRVKYSSLWQLNDLTVVLFSQHCEIGVFSTDYSGWPFHLWN